MASGNIGGRSIGSGGMITDDAAWASFVDAHAMNDAAPPSSRHCMRPAPLTRRFLGHDFAGSGAWWSRTWKDADRTQCVGIDVLAYLDGLTSIIVTLGDEQVHVRRLPSVAEAEAETRGAVALFVVARALAAAVLP